MEYSELEQNIKKALQILIEKDKYLFINDLSERSIVHRLALYINEIFQDFGYNVDCEYNGLPNESRKRKYLKVLIDDLINLNLLTDREKALIEQGNLPQDGNLQKLVFPDVIIHKRGETVNNLAIIECKKSSNNSSNERKYDKLKLIHYQNSEFLNYQYGIFIDFIVGENPNFKIQKIERNNQV